MNFFPGPNNLVALVHGTETDAWRASLAGLARLPVMILMLMLLAVGLEVLLATSAAAFRCRIEYQPMANDSRNVAKTQSSGVRSLASNRL